MRKYLFMAACVLFVASSGFAQSGRDRSATRFEAIAIVQGPDALNTLTPYLPELFWPLQKIMDFAGVATVSQLNIRLRLITDPQVIGSYTRPVRNFSDPAFLSQHPRFAAGVFHAPIWRARVSGNSRCYTQTQLMQVAAAAGQDVPFTLDLSSYTPADYYVVEHWPGYDVRTEVFTGGQWKVLSTQGYERNPIGLSLKVPASAESGCE